jgi:hypothetical protein
MSKSIKEFRKPTHDEISALAQRMYVKEGRPQGKAMEHWLKAEAQLNAERRAEVEAAGAKSSEKAPAASRMQSPPNAAGWQTATGPGRQNAHRN